MDFVGFALPKPPLVALGSPESCCPPAQWLCTSTALRVQGMVARRGRGGHPRSAAPSVPGEQGQVPGLGQALSSYKALFLLQGFQPFFP